MGKQGKREFVQVLRLMEVFSADEVAAAVRNAIARGAISFDAVKHLGTSKNTPSARPTNQIQRISLNLTTGSGCDGAIGFL
jgi:hypothetical protein